MSKPPQNCKEEYVERVCDYCPLNNFHMVGHPGGHYAHQVEHHYCSEDFWEDDF